ncbi:MAG: DNA mismatch repair endonuclease MutL [Candidatus Cloacimonetes bacterium]|nr:DNA mismatch repair endonuclease MutL [Candidatus Cloacimonadota bacterium]
MGNIRILTEEVANRIAAGEVIERPASVVKELVENAIDAGATRITVAIEKGGKQLIQVSDNGCGMREDDALQCFERHATSKINTVQDIFSIHTLGFRGEALPSIASVSKLQLITKIPEDDVATVVEFDGGRLSNMSKTSANSGTTITVRRLFSNVPARRKFLKTDQVEFKHILNYLHYQSILYPHINFTFISNNTTKLNYPAVNTSQDRLLAVFGTDFLKKDIIEIEASGRNMNVTGYIGGLEEDQATIADYKYLFVNGRYIKDKVVFHSIKTAYEPFIKKLRIFQNGSTPPYILFLNVDADKVDFNVHPAKLELRFTDPHSVHSFIKTTITNALLDYEDAKYRQIKQTLSSVIQTNQTSQLEQKIFTRKTDQRRFSEYKKELEKVYQPDLFRTEDPQDKLIEERMIQPEIIVKPEEEIINPWQLHQSYIFVQTDDGLLVIDQHAAHERVLYEKILQRIHGASAQTQKLLFPIVIDLPNHLTHIIPELIEHNLEIFTRVGFSLKSFSGNSIVIDEIPAELEEWDGGEIFIDILRQLQEEYGETEDFRDSMAKSVSCKAAIKAGRKMTKREMVVLINDLFACQVPYFCPHGRPLMIKLSLTYFEKKFKRIES